MCKCSRRERRLNVTGVVSHLCAVVIALLVISSCAKNQRDQLPRWASKRGKGIIPSFRLSLQTTVVSMLHPITAT